MAKLSRTAKYKDLRERLQNDNDADINAPALSEYESRLNRIDANNFAAPRETPQRVHTEGTHARVEPRPEHLQRRREERNTGGYENISSNENYTAPSFDNDYLNRYIQEVKQYNIDQGNAVSDRTEVNILNSLHNDRPASRPFPSSRSQSRADNDFEDTGDGNVAPLRTARTQPRQTQPEQPVRRQPDHSLDYTDQINQPEHNQYQEDFTNDLDFDDDLDDVPAASQSQADQSPTREDIMAQVQSMVAGQQSRASSQPQPASRPAPVQAHQPVQPKPQEDHEVRTARQKLINETNQMRAQLDDYGDNLNEVSDKMRHTNQILNTVLIVLIIALAVVLGVVIFWIIRG